MSLRLLWHLWTSCYIYFFPAHKTAMGTPEILSLPLYTLQMLHPLAVSVIRLVVSYANKVLNSTQMGYRVATQGYQDE